MNNFTILVIAIIYLQNFEVICLDVRVVLSAGVYYVSGWTKPV